jgi:hypothetical protein
MLIGQVNVSDQRVIHFPVILIHVIDKEPRYYQDFIAYDDGKEKRWREQWIFDSKEPPKDTPYPSAPQWTQ